MRKASKMSAASPSSRNTEVRMAQRHEEASIRTTVNHPVIVAQIDFPDAETAFNLSNELRHLRSQRFCMLCMKRTRLQRGEDKVCKIVLCTCQDAHVLMRGGASEDMTVVAHEYVQELCACGH